ncbi:unnamed protein product [Urochloa decumbens]|uniref:Uncharacterized protein n=1 Tax=Urochloa decumbens TaxID=240449 RepID=A0ABC9C2V0_9POAL
MADIEAAARAPPRAPPLPPPAPRRPAAAEVKAAVADAVIYCFVGATFASSAASIALVVARYAVGGGGSSSSSYAHAAVAFARDVFLRALAAELLLCPFTILLLLLRLDKRPPEPPEELVVIWGVYATVQLHGPEHPGARRRRQGGGYGLIPLLIFIVLSMGMMVGLLFQEHSPANRRCVETLGPAALISDTGSFACSVMVICVFIPYMLVQLTNMPR